MKIFFLDKNPYWAARYYEDTNIVDGIHDCKRVLIDGYYKNANPLKVNFSWNIISQIIEDTIFSPESRWSCKNLTNWSWILFLGMALCIEQHRRFDSVGQESLFFRWCYQHPPNLPMGLPLSDFPIIQKENNNGRQNKVI